MYPTNHPKLKKDPTASTLENIDEYLNEGELKQYVEEHQIMKILQLEIDMVRMKSESNALMRIYGPSDFPSEEMDRMIKQEMNQVEKLFYEKTSWNMGMCLIQDKEKYID